MHINSPYSLMHTGQGIEVGEFLVETLTTTCVHAFPFLAMYSFIYIFFLQSLFSHPGFHQIITACFLMKMNTTAIVLWNQSCQGPGAHVVGEAQG